MAGKYKKRRRHVSKKCGPLEESIGTANVAKAQHRLANFKRHDLTGGQKFLLLKKTNNVIFSGRWMSTPKECA